MSGLMAERLAAVRCQAHDVAAWLARRARTACRSVATLALQPQRGQSMVEYAIVLALVSLVAMAAVTTLGTGIGQVFSNILLKIQGLGR